MRLNEARLRKIVREELAARGEMQMHEGFFDKIFGGKKEPEKTLLDILGALEGSTKFDNSNADLVDQALAAAVKEKKISEADAKTAATQCEAFYKNVVTSGEGSISNSIKRVQEKLAQLNKNRQNDTPKVSDYNKANIEAALETMQQVSEQINAAGASPGHRLYYGILAAGFGSMCMNYSFNVADVADKGSLSTSGLMKEAALPFNFENYAKFFRERIKSVHATLNGEVKTINNIGLFEALQKHFSGDNMALKPLFAKDLPAAVGAGATKAESFRRGPNDVVLVERWQRLAGLLK